MFFVNHFEIVGGYRGLKRKAANRETKTVARELSLTFSSYTLVNFFKFVFDKSKLKKAESLKVLQHHNSLRH